MTPLEQKVREIQTQVWHHGALAEVPCEKSVQVATAAIMRLVEEEQSLARQMVWELEAQLTRQKEVVVKMASALMLISAPKRPDGTYNRSREACEQLAREALTTHKELGGV